jgi:hypothetical protein
LRVGGRKDILPVQTKPIDGLTLFFDTDEQEAAELIGGACERSARLIRDSWGLGTPKDCRVYVMTSWLRFLFHSAPWHWKVLLVPSLPLWVSRVSRIWRYAGGWMQRYGDRRAVGVKPPRILELADRSFGVQIFVPEEDIARKVEQVTCHELTHAFAAHLRLPMWLNEGLAMLTVDRLVGKPTVVHQTVETLRRSATKAGPAGYRDLRWADRDAVVYHTVRGYWITRYLEETHPGLVRSMLSERHGQQALEDKVAAVLGMKRDEFWSAIDGVAAAHFEQNGEGE